MFFISQLSLYILYYATLNLSVIMKSPNYRDHLKTIWYDIRNPGSFTGPEKLYRLVKKEGKYKIGRTRIKQWLQDQDSYGLSRNVVRKFPRSRYVVNTIDSLWEMDLADFSAIQADNDGYKLLLVVIDVFSKFLWVQPLKDKRAHSVIKALKVILSTRKPRSIKSDKGSEFKNKDVQMFLKKEGISTYYSQNETKAAVVERVIRTLKSSIYRYFRHEQTHRYVNVIQNLVSDYNNRPHRSIGQFSPSDVNESNADEVRYSSYLARKHVSKSFKKNRRKFKFKVGDLVRITHDRRPFQRDYQQKWTEEIFKIRRRYVRDQNPVYQVKDFGNEEIEGTFYQPELQRVNKDQDTVWKIEKILKKRTRGGVKQALVRWLGWPKKFDSWIDVKEIQ